jgi:hypothetical protein
MARRADRPLQGDGKELTWIMTCLGKYGAEIDYQPESVLDHGNSSELIVSEIMETHYGTVQLVRDLLIIVGIIVWMITLIV